jgi:lipopolysaccharide transport system permease protein
MPLQIIEAKPQSTLSATTTVVTPHHQPSLLQGLRQLWERRQLVGIMVYRDLIGRYKGSLMGAFWPVINPLGHLLLYTFVFNVILHVKFTKNPSAANFALYFMTGLIPWGAFSEAVSRSTTAILEAPNLVKRVVFPVEVLPLALVLSGVLSQTIAASVLLVAVSFSGCALTWKLALLPAVVLSQALFTCGLCWFLSALGVYLRDLKHVLALVLSAWMFTTPIVYPASSFPANLQFVLWLNPMAGVVSDYRRVILEGHMPYWPMYCTYTAIGVFVALFGFTFFYKTKRSFADVM